MFLIKQEVKTALPLHRAMTSPSDLVLDLPGAWSFLLMDRDNELSSPVESDKVLYSLSIFQMSMGFFLSEQEALVNKNKYIQIKNEKPHSSMLKS